MADNILMIGGSKGGVGKTILTMTTLDHLIQTNKEPFLIESDASNPDVWKSYGSHLPSEILNLDEANGWVKLVNMTEQHPQNIFVINTAARNNNSVTLYGETLNSSLSELKRKLITLWIINRQRDSLELLREYMNTMTHSLIHVIRNLYYGEEKKFELYNESKLKTLIEQQGGKSLNFPDLADRVADDLYSNRLSISKALQQQPLGNRAELTRWRHVVKTMLEQVIHE